MKFIHKDKNFGGQKMQDEKKTEQIKDLFYEMREDALDKNLEPHYAFCFITVDEENKKEHIYTHGCGNIELCLKTMFQKLRESGHLELNESPYDGEI